MGEKTVCKHVDVRISTRAGPVPNEKEGAEPLVDSTYQRGINQIKGPHKDTHGQGEANPSTATGGSKPCVT